MDPIRKDFKQLLKVVDDVFPEKTDIRRCEFMFYFGGHIVLRNIFQEGIPNSTKNIKIMDEELGQWMIKFRKEHNI